LLASLLIPSKPQHELKIVENHSNTLRANAKLLMGSILTFTGFFFVFNIFGVINYFSFVGISPELFGTGLLIFGGIYIYRRKNVVAAGCSGENKLLRSQDNGRLSGLCGGLAKYMNTDSNTIRMTWLIFSFLSIGIGVVLYLIAWILIPLEPENYE
jgi:phage shock protein PspC (stress-responsive transcriptional regulator)